MLEKQYYIPEPEEFMAENPLPESLKEVNGENRFFRLFHAKQFTGKPSQNLRLFRLKIFAAIPAVPMPARPGSPFGLMHVPEEQPYDTLIPDFRESRENSERPFLCRRVFLAFACEIISNHDSVNYD